MGTTHEFTLVADSDFTEKLGYAVKVKAELVHNTPVASIADAGKAIAGIVTDITAPATAGAPLAIARIGDIALAAVGTGGITVGDELEVGSDGRLVTKSSGAVVAVALGTAKENERVPVLLK